MKKKLLAAAAMGIFGVGLAMALPQDQGNSNAEARHADGRRPDPQRQAQMMAKRLNLSSDQEKQLVPILADRQTQFESIRKDSSLSADDKHSKIQAAREESETKIKSILTDSQKQAYDQMQQQMRDRMKQHHEGGQSGAANNPQ